MQQKKWPVKQTTSISLCVAFIEVAASENDVYRQSCENMKRFSHNKQHVATSRVGRLELDATP